MTLCVIIAARNEEKYISPALRSVLTQAQDVALRIITVNDGSTDRTGEILAEFADSSFEIEVFETSGIGVSAARNCALKALRPTDTFVTFLDGDDVMVSGYLARAMQHFADQPELEVTYSRLQMVESDIPDLHDASETAEEPVVGISLSSGIYRKHLIDRIGLLNTEFAQAEDFDFLLRLFETSPRAKMIEDVSIFYRQHENNTTNSTAELRRYVMKAMLEHSKRRKANPELADVAWIWGTKVRQEDQTP